MLGLRRLDTRNLYANISRQTPTWKEKEVTLQQLLGLLIQGRPSEIDVQLNRIRSFYKTRIFMTV
jgi:hypothetical protein